MSMTSLSKYVCKSVHTRVKHIIFPDTFLLSLNFSIICFNYKIVISIGYNYKQYRKCYHFAIKYREKNSIIYEFPSITTISRTYRVYTLSTNVLVHFPGLALIEELMKTFYSYKRFLGLLRYFRHKNCR